MCIAYLGGAARTRTGGIFLFAVTVLLAIATLALFNWTIAVFVALPGLWGYRAVHAT
jgi:hypothetical protein